MKNRYLGGELSNKGGFEVFRFTRGLAKKRTTRKKESKKKESNSRDIKISDLRSVITI